ncbi:hypothetical protein HDU86_002953 [Geranomyces michiganensis]|nr:hypothetical protein HDU86_002953 [Geranomyces michiganensis]
MAGPAAPLLVAATVVGAAAALMLNNRKDSSSPSGLRVDHSGSSGTGGIPVRPVAYRHVAQDDITSAHGEEQRWARSGSSAGAWKYVF